MSPYAEISNLDLDSAYKHVREEFPLKSKWNMPSLSCRRNKQCGPERNGSEPQCLTRQSRRKRDAMKSGELVERASLFSKEVIEGDAVLIALTLHLLDDLGDTGIGLLRGKT